MSLAFERPPETERCWSGWRPMGLLTALLALNWRPMGPLTAVLVLGG